MLYLHLSDFPLHQTVYSMETRANELKSGLCVLTFGPLQSEEGV